MIPCARCGQSLDPHHRPIRRRRVPDRSGNWANGTMLVYHSSCPPLALFRARLRSWANRPGRTVLR